MTLPLVENILGQPDSLRAVAEYQLGEGRAKIEAAASALRSARKVVLSGMGSSLFACLPLELYLNQHGVPAVAVDTSELLHYRSAICGPGTAVLLVSRSGETVEALKLMERLEGSGAVVIGATNEPGTTLALKPPHSFFINSHNDQLVAVQTYGGTAAALLLLGATVCAKPEAMRAGLSATANALQSMIESCGAASENWKPFFHPARCVYLLGRGASLASTLEGALLFHEVAKTPAVSMGAAHFRHGPVEVLDREFRAIVFASQRQTAGLDAAISADLRELGGRVFPVGPFADGGITWNSGLVPEIFAPLLEIVPVQFAALRLAQWNGVVPGDFRFATAITRTETGFARP